MGNHFRLDALPGSGRQGGDGEEGDDTDSGMGQGYDVVHHVDEMQVKGAGHNAKCTLREFSSIVTV